MMMAMMASHCSLALIARKLKQQGGGRQTGRKKLRASSRKGEQEPPPLTLPPVPSPPHKLRLAVPKGAPDAEVGSHAGTSGATPMSRFRNPRTKSRLRVLLHRRYLWSLFAQNAFRPDA